MKKRTAFIDAILSLIPLGQPLIIKTGAVLSTTGFLLSFSEKVYAKNSMFYFNRAFDKEKKGDYLGAIADYTKAIEIDPEDIESYNNRGLVKHELEDYSGAIADYTKAIEINPTYYVDPYVNRGVAKYELNDYSGAIADYTKAIELFPKNKYAYFNRGFAKLELEKKNFIRFVFTNRLKSACADWRKAYSLGEEAALDVLENQCNNNN